MSVRTNNMNIQSSSLLRYCDLH